MMVFLISLQFFRSKEQLSKPGMSFLVTLIAVLGLLLRERDALKAAATQRERKIFSLNSPLIMLRLLLLKRPPTCTIHRVFASFRSVFFGRTPDRTSLSKSHSAKAKEASNFVLEAANLRIGEAVS